MCLWELAKINFEIKFSIFFKFLNLDNTFLASFLNVLLGNEL